MCLYLHFARARAKRMGANAFRKTPAADLLVRQIGNPVKKKINSLISTLTTLKLCINRMSTVVTYDVGAGQHREFPIPVAPWKKLWAAKQS